MQNSEIKKLNLDFNLDDNKNEKKESVDFLLNKKQDSENSKNAAIELTKMQIQSQSKESNLIVIDPTQMINLGTLLKTKPRKIKRLQTYITEELYQAIEQFKRTTNVKKDSEVIEALLRISLGLKQI